MFYRSSQAVSRGYRYTETAIGTYIKKDLRLLGHTRLVTTSLVSSNYLTIHPSVALRYIGITEEELDRYISTRIYNTPPPGVRSYIVGN